MRRLLDWFHRSTSAPARSEPRSALYEEARRLGIEGRSRMDRRQLEEAIASARRTNRTSLPARLHVGLFATRARNARLRIRAARLYLGEIALGRLVSLLRSPGPLRAVILSAATLATGVLGVLVAYAVVPQESAAAQDGVQLVTITGPGGTRTVAVTRTKEGITKVVPVRVLRTVTGPEGVSTIAVTGPSLTDTEVITQVRHSTQTQVLHNTETSVVTVTQPVTVVETDVVTQSETVVLTDTVVVTETETVIVPPGQP
jgi:hypothetical protein